MIGGTSILAGKGGYAGTVAGAIIVTIIDSMLQIVHIAEAGRNIINGVIILLLLLIYGRKRNAGK
jgi:ribose transport system permease protein